jgi:hypothetical protein
VQIFEGIPRVLTALSALQIAVLIVLIFRLVSLEDIIESLEVAALHTTETGATPQPSAANRSRTAPAATSVDEEQLRRIIREELATISMRNSAADPTIDAGSPEQRSDEDIDHEERRASVDSKIDHYIAQGAISESEMSDLQQEIAGLDEAGRRQALRKLVKALNSGQLEGHL